MLTIFAVEAQKKPNINKAKSFWQNGLYDQSKEILDAATTYEKTMNDGNTWYYRGLLYASIDTTSNSASRELSDNAFEISLQSFQKAEELGNGKGYGLVTAYGVTTMDQQLVEYYNYYYRLAIDNYEMDGYVEASKNFESAATIIKTDTSAIANAGYAAMASEDSIRALNMFRESVSRGARGKGIYGNLINIHLGKKNADKALEVVREALVVYPNANDFKRQEITILINEGRAEEAKDELLTAIANEPGDPALYFALGLLNEELGDKEAALAAYQSALDSDPNHYSSAFNRAVMIFNDANTLYKEKAALGISKADLAKAKALDPKIKEGFTKALPAWEKVYAIKKAERPTLETLLFLYAYLGEEKKADKIEEELIALGDEE
ncbi:MAG: tetratricopeptide repeat protein [Cyclobacteriaceae bacterium]